MCLRPVCRPNGVEGLAHWHSQRWTSARRWGEVRMLLICGKIGKTERRVGFGMGRMISG